MELHLMNLFDFKKWLCKHYKLELQAFKELIKSWLSCKVVWFTFYFFHVVALLVIFRRNLLRSEIFQFSPWISFSGSDLLTPRERSIRLFARELNSNCPTIFNQLCLLRVVKLKRDGYSLCHIMIILLGIAPKQFRTPVAHFTLSLKNSKNSEIFLSRITQNSLMFLHESLVHFSKAVEWQKNAVRFDFSRYSNSFSSKKSRTHVFHRELCLQFSIFRKNVLEKYSSVVLQHRNPARWKMPKR